MAPIVIPVIAPAFNASYKRRDVITLRNLVIHYLPLAPSPKIPGRVVAVGVPSNECITVV